MLDVPIRDAEIMASRLSTHESLSLDEEIEGHIPLSKILSSNSPSPERTISSKQEYASLKQAVKAAVNSQCTDREKRASKKFPDLSKKVVDVSPPKRICYNKIIETQKQTQKKTNTQETKNVL